MTKRNPHLAKLHTGYLFPEIFKRKVAFEKENPNVEVINLGIGDTTQPIPEAIVKGMSDAVQRLGTPEGYTGYGPEKGSPILRELIASVIYKNIVKADDIFISDGSKCDIGRLQVLFGTDATVALQDPTYPAYVDTAIGTGKGGSFDTSADQYQRINYLPCLPENDFFPDLSKASRSDLIFYCSPNNPTGSVASKEQLQKLVDFAKKNRSILLYDAAYAHFIHDPNLPKSIYEVEGAKDVAIEMGSFSKMAGFTGVRLGWIVVPEELKFEDGSSVHKDWHRLHHTFFNGASNIAQAGGIAALEPQGWKEVIEQTKFYLENARLLREVFVKKGFKVYGGEHAPYLWVYIPKKKSWDIFEEWLHKAHLLVTPGIGFGPSGEHFIRISALGHRKNVLKAVERINKFL